MTITIKFNDEDEGSIIEVADAMEMNFTEAEYFLNQGVIEIECNGESHEDIRNWFNDHEYKNEIEISFN